MLLKYERITLRNAGAADAAQLAAWWNDGALMAHAGFPNGTGQTPESVAADIRKDADGVHRRLIIELDGRPVGEMMYENLGDGTAEIGIKICDASEQEKGWGKIALSLLIAALFRELGFRKVILDTDVQNKRAQHVYERLGFRKARVRENAWRDQLGQMRSYVDYEVIPEYFINFAE
ncbi:MAG: GNAT family N-acetyltransferase [Oscillospiraceae bacterium]|jgi:RimJ/RimL family protein N-acetyltransferase|nr:GNAT family N-acetyltransferase [Oscillospiraceae bacterium]